LFFNFWLIINEILLKSIGTKPKNSPPKTQVHFLLCCGAPTVNNFGQVDDRDGFPKLPKGLVGKDF
jgi:hypothetical protein